MPSFIFQLASTAAAFTALQIHSASAAPVDLDAIKIHRNIDSDTLTSQSRFPSASTIEVRQLHTIYPVMRTMSRDEYHLSMMNNNQHYHATLQSIVGARAEAEQNDSGDSPEQQSRFSDAVDYALIGACTAKVVADLEDINAYHRGIMQDADLAYEQGISSPIRHTINVLELRQTRQEALSLQIYSDLDIVRAAEEHCLPSAIQAILQESGSHRSIASSSKDHYSLDMLD